MRLFLAIELSEAARRHLVRLQEVLRPVARASYTRGENLHLTLKFLGEVEDARLKGICDALAGLPRMGEIEMAAERVVCFPERGRVRIIGAGMTVPAALLELVNHIEDGCAALGFGREGRPYAAHVTLARAREPLAWALRGELEKAAKDVLPGPGMRVREFVLVQSVLDRRGAVYTVAGRFACGAG